jgi:hypothetical protein
MMKRTTISFGLLAMLVLPSMSALAAGSPAKKGGRAEAVRLLNGFADRVDIHRTQDGRVDVKGLLRGVGNDVADFMMRDRVLVTTGLGTPIATGAGAGYGVSKLTSNPLAIAGAAGVATVGTAVFELLGVAPVVLFLKGGSAIP